MPSLTRLSSGDDVSLLAQLATARFRAYGALDPFIDGDLDTAALGEAFSRAVDPTWVVSEAHTMTGYLHGATFQVRRQTTRTWTGLDGWAATTPSDLDLLLPAAHHHWRARGATQHCVWVPQQSEITLWTNHGYRPWSVRATSLLTDRPIPSPHGTLRRGGREHLEAAVRFDELIDAAQGVATAALDDGERRANRTDVEEIVGDPDNRYFVYDVNGEIVGQCLGTTAPALRGTHPDTLLIAEVAVRPDWQRRGIGRAMIADLLAREQPHYRYADVRYRTTNTGAASFWTALGFRPVLLQLRKDL